MAIFPAPNHHHILPASSSRARRTLFAFFLCFGLFIHIVCTIGATPAGASAAAIAPQLRDPRDPRNNKPRTGLVDDTDKDDTEDAVEPVEPTDEYSLRPGTADTALAPLSSSSSTVPDVVESSAPQCEATDIVLVITLDGKLHGFNRLTGEILWTKDADDGWGPLVKVVNRASAKREANSSNSKGTGSTDIGILPPEGAELPVMEDEYAEEDGDEKEEEEDFDEGVYIPEPMGEGHLYHYMPGQPVKRLSLSLKKIVEKTPVYVSGGKIHTARKVTRLYALDPFTGRTLSSYGDDGLKVLEDKYLHASHERSVYIGRTQYIFAIQDAKVSSPGATRLRWNITYGEYSTANPTDLFSGSGNTGALGGFADPLVAGNPEVPPVKVFADVNGDFAYQDES
ncbi:bifunctional endoribonuclease/protein kinase ire1, partial [Quaeritorhiza haematococci]